MSLTPLNNAATKLAAEKNAAYAAKMANGRRIEKIAINTKQKIANIKKKHNTTMADQNRRMESIIPTQNELVSDRAWWDPRGWVETDAKVRSMLTKEQREKIYGPDREWYDPRGWVGLGRRTRKSRSRKMRKSRSRKMRV